MYRDNLTKNFLFKNPSGTLIYVWLYVNQSSAECLTSPHYRMGAYEIHSDHAFMLHPYLTEHFPSNQEVKDRYGVAGTVLISDTPEEIGLEYQIKYMPESLSYAEQALYNCFNSYSDKLAAIIELRKFPEYLREHHFIQFVTLIGKLKGYNQCDTTIYAMADYMRVKCDQTDGSLDIALSEVITELFGKGVTFSRNYWLYSRAGIAYQRRKMEAT